MVSSRAVRDTYRVASIMATEGRMRFEARERYGAGELQATASWSEVAGGIVGRVVEHGVFPGGGISTVCRVYSLRADSADASIEEYSEAIVHAVFAGLRAVREALGRGEIAPGCILDLTLYPGLPPQRRVLGPLDGCDEASRTP